MSWIGLFYLTVEIGLFFAYCGKSVSFFFIHLRSPHPESGFGPFGVSFAYGSSTVSKKTNSK